MQLGVGPRKPRAILFCIIELSFLSGLSTVSCGSIGSFLLLRAPSRPYPQLDSSMIPGAGLYLPESLHVNPDAASNPTVPRTTKHKYFERKSAPMQDKDRNLNSSRTSVALSRKSTEDVTKVFSSLSTVFDFADYASSHEKVTSDGEVFVNLLQRVRQDVTEASRLYTSQPVVDYFESWPDKKTWIDAILLDIQRALNDLGVYMETVRVSGDDGGTVGLRRKFDWVLSHQKKLISKQQNLTVCHQSLMTALQVMLTAEMNVAFGGQDPVYEVPAQPWIQEDARDIFRSPHSRQKWRLSQKNLSLPSIMVSEADGDKLDGMPIGFWTREAPNVSTAHLIDSAPVELPGSTPEDLPLPDNWDLYASPTKPRSASMDAISLGRSATQLPAVVGTDVHIPRPETTSHLKRSIRSPTSPLPPRRSFDQVRPPASPTHQKPRASLDQQRPRAYSDQVLPSSLAIRPRASFDQVRPLPTLNEKPLERYDSNASVSVTQAATVPLTTIRARPRAVNVRKPPTKHRSLPSTLPQFHSQSSLMDDLSNWVLPSSARDSYHSNDSPISLSSSTPSTSIASSPVSTKSPTDYPGYTKGLPPVTVPATDVPSINVGKPLSVQAPPTYIPYRPPPPQPSRSPPPAPYAITSTISATRARLQERIMNRAPKLHLPESTSKHEMNSIRPASASESNTVTVEATPTPAPVTEVLPSLPPRPRKNTLEQKTVAAIQTELPAESKVFPPERVEAPKDKTHEQPAMELPVLDAKTSPTASIPSIEHSLPGNNTVEPAKPAMPIAPSPPLGTVSSEVRQTAQAKRRAAHARRMQLAFGAEKDKAGAV
jgi:hypothetical protein